MIVTLPCRGGRDEEEEEACAESLRGEKGTTVPLKDRRRD